MHDKLLNNVKTFALAGGSGTRLMPLTDMYAKPAVPFLGVYVIFDFVMWSLYYSGLRNIGVLVQKNAVSLTEHIAAVFPRRPGGGVYLQTLCPEGRCGRHVFSGTADAVWQHIHHAAGYDTVMIVSGDHIYKADFSVFERFHREHDADLSVMAITVPVEDAKAFGVIDVDADNKIVDVVEKPAHPKEVHGNPGQAFCSMGVYCFKKKVLKQYLDQDALDQDSSHDFGRDIVPKMIADGKKVYAFPFSETKIDGELPYWRDVGSIKAYWEEHQNFCSDNPLLNLYSDGFRLPPRDYMAAPSKFGSGTKNSSSILNSLVPSGCIIVDSYLLYTTLGVRVTVREGCKVVMSIIPSQVIIDHHCSLHKTIIVSDPYLRSHQRVLLPANMEIGFDHDLDRKRGFTVTEEGITVVPFTWFKRNKLIVSGKH